MKILIMIMSAGKQPALRNEEAIFNSYIKSYDENKSLFKHTYDFVTYKGGYNEVHINNRQMYLTSPDDIESTFIKTLEAFDIIKDYDYDYLIRVNISTYVNLFLIDKEIENLNKNFIYCNAICTYYKSSKLLNQVFPRGDAYIIHKDLLFNILNCKNNIDDLIDNGVDPMDDSMFGVLCAKYFSNKTHNHIKLLEYSFIPQMITALDIMEVKKSAYTFFTRLKTCPPDSYSGYSWDDNQYRIHDQYKFNFINDYVYKIKNTNTSMIYSNNKDRCFHINHNDRIEMISFDNLIQLHNNK